MVEVGEYQHRAPRLAWRAVFLGMFASWYYRVLPAQHSGVLNLRDVPANDDACLFFSTKEFRNEWGEACTAGCVAYPAIAGLSSLVRKKKYEFSEHPTEAIAKK